MRCKKHFSDVSSCVGICASCLREHLLSLIDAQSRLSPLTPPPPPPIVFPRSVSPYVSRRKSDASSDADFSDQLRQQRRFFSTPQVDSTNSTKKKSKFRAIANLFRSRSGKSAPQSTSSDPLSNPSNTTTLELFSLDETSAYDGRRGRLWFGSRNRGMSPGDDPDRDHSPEKWKRTPSSARGSTRTSQSQVRVKASPARSHVASGISICLSPLMRPSSSRKWNWKGVGPVEAGYSISLRANRSRKFADLGRFNYNH